MPVALFALPGSRQVQRLHQTLQALSPGSARLFSSALNEVDRVSMNSTGLLWNGARFAPGERAFLHGFSYCDPVVPSADPEADWSVWRFDYLEDQQKYSFLHSCFSELARQGVQVINPPDIHRTFFMKAFLLERLRQAGFAVPQTICTNRLDVAEAFCRDHPKVVWRPGTGRAAWQLCLKPQREALCSPRKPPVLLAAVSDGPLVRGYLFEGQPLLLLHCSPPCMAPEELLEEFWEVQYPGLQGEFSRLAEDLGATWLEIHFVYQDGKALLYDMEADPLYDCLPASYQEKLTALLAARLLGLDAASLGARVAALERASRPTLYLRRMLQILFEVEAQKYE